MSTAVELKRIYFYSLLVNLPEQKVEVEFGEKSVVRALSPFLAYGITEE